MATENQINNQGVSISLDTVKEVLGDKEMVILFQREQIKKQAEEIKKLQEVLNAKNG